MEKMGSDYSRPPLILITIHFHLNTALQKKNHAENSVNPAATDNFSHAALVAHYVKIIHDRFFVDYDSVLFKPFYNLESSFFKKGQQGIKSGNLGEEAVWWYLIHSERMAFSTQGRKDSSMWISTLAPNASWELREQLFNYFMAITNGEIQGVQFGKPVSDTAIQNGNYSKQQRRQRLNDIYNIASIHKLLIMILVLLVPQILNAGTADDRICLKPKVNWNNYQWTLITGNDMESCEEMLAYLKSRPADQPPPTCPEDRLPSNDNWSRPESRILSKTEQQAIIDSIPVDRPLFKKWYGPRLRGAKSMKVIKADITRDGIPEMFLSYSFDGSQACKRSVRCAIKNSIFKDAYKFTVMLKSDSTDLLPMTSDGKQVDWNHRTIGFSPMLMLGELIFYKGLPYWLSSVQWDQASHDDFTHSVMRPNDPYSAIFTLVEVWTYSQHTPQSKKFEDVTSVFPKILDPKRKNYCRFGYFHRDNLLINAPHN